MSHSSELEREARAISDRLAAGERLTASLFARRCSSTSKPITWR